MRRILITGASGFVGSHLVTTAVQRGWSVVAGVRQPVANPQAGVEYRRFPDFNDESDLSPLLRDIHAVVHLVSLTHQADRERDGDEAAFWRLNVEGTRRLLTACANQGVSHFVYLSSIKALGEGTQDPQTPCEPYSELSPSRPSTLYGQSKRAAEELVMKWAGPERHVSILRPPLVYGPGVKGNLLTLMQLIQRGYWLPFKSISNRRSLVGVHNLCDALCHVLERAPAGVTLYHVADREVFSTPQLISTLSHFLNCQDRQFPLPWRYLAYAAVATNRRQQVGRLIGSLTVCTERIQRELGWMPPQTAEQGLQAMAEWFLSGRPIPREQPLCNWRTKLSPWQRCGSAGGMHRRPSTSSHRSRTVIT